LKVVADSHAIVWYLQGSDRLSRLAADALEQAERTEGIVVSVATLIDLWYVTQTTQGVTVADLSRLRDHLARSPAVELTPITVEVADATTALPRAVVTDPWDRFIVATAIAFGTALVTRDDQIRHSDLVATIW
jgi:PIN domain nuclease of toxin-antitoxin system